LNREILVSNCAGPRVEVARAQARGGLWQMRRSGPTTGRTH
jgi:hypothetical protein